jgi:hypothetical protein
MGLLDNVTGQRKLRPRRILLYGTRGIGKSTWATMADKPIVIPTEDGLEHIACKAFFEDRPSRKCESYAEYMQCLRELYATPLDYKTVVTDSLDWLEHLVIAEACRRERAECLEELHRRTYGKGYDLVLPLWREILSAHDFLRNDRGLMVIFVAHFTLEKVKAPDSDSYTRYAPKLHKQAADIVQEWCDEVLFACYKNFTTVKEEGFGVKRAVAIGSGERVIKTTERPTHLAKNRLSLPDEIALDWREYAKHLPENRQAALAAQIDRTEAALKSAGILAA